MKIWINKNEYGYSTMLKNEYNGEKITMFMNVQFKKDIEPNETIYANVKDCFLSCYATKDGEVKPKLVVMNYERIQKNSDDFLDDDELVEIDDNFLD